MHPRDAGRTRQQVLILTASVGAGHNAAARAVLDRLRADAPELDADCADVLDFAPRAFRVYYAGGFKLCMTTFHRTYGWGFWLSDRPHRAGRGLLERPRLGMERLALRSLGQYVRDRRPDLIVNTHFLPAAYLGGEIARGRIDARQMLIVTDCRMHRFWYSENVEHWFAPAEFTADRLRQWGVPDERITVSGMPVHAKWTQPVDRRQVLADWNLPADKHVVLVTGGTDFVCGPIAKLARRIVQSCAEAFVVVLAGRNKKLLARIAASGASDDRLVAVGFTDRLHELLHVCSLMVTKTGGATTAECLAKGTPMVLLKPVPGQEAGNARYFAREGAAVLTRSVGQVVAEVQRLLSDAAARARLGANARRLYRPATEIIVRTIRRAVTAPCPPPAASLARAGGRPRP